MTAPGRSAWTLDEAHAEALRQEHGPCPRCDGVGTEKRHGWPGPAGACPMCGGRGFIVSAYRVPCAGCEWQQATDADDAIGSGDEPTRDHGDGPDHTCPESRAD